MTRIVILSAGFGEGHNAAARNLASAIDEKAGLGTARILDLFELASPRLNHLSRKGYLWIINRHPRLWSSFYSMVESPSFLPRHLWLLRKEMALLEERSRTLGAKLLCSTYPVYAFMAEKLRNRGRLKLPFYNVVTDSISINSLWTRPRCDGWFVPNPETASELLRQGVPAHRIHDTGFPVQSYFSKQGRDLNPPPLDGHAGPRVLVILNSGIRNAEATARQLIERSSWDLCFAVGRDKALHERLSRAARGRRGRTEILGWTDQVPRLLLTHHVLVSKAGGATTQEAIAARCPMIVNQIVPGQEEGNYELLRRRNIGARAETPESVIAALSHAFDYDGHLWNRWRTSLASLARPDAASSIADHLLAASDHP